MENKTCGECKHFANFGCNKIKNCGFISNTNIACCLAEWKKPTNGDKIRQGGNRALAEFQQHLSCTNCVYFSVKMAGQEFCHKPDDKTCTDGIEAWLDQEAKNE